ncbi:MAG: MBL fold metallo-hydrolase [Clostridiales Family XIII bacterium]|jgi:glyoxylase-like metal-dependent hydrolase (beta-lactamase superfamily II)|nr:MBL fold metallo-hydrolase [Clostridiales Family XIII bacterium]
MNIRKYTSGSVGTNSYLVDDGQGKAFIVDAGEYDPRLADAVKDDGLEVIWLILTHGHGDHIGGVQRYLDEFPGCKLAAGEAEKPILSDPARNFSREICGTDITPEADLYLKDGDALQAGTIDLQILETPGHTPGGICILAENDLFSGDTLFQASIGRTDLPGGSLESLLDSIRAKLFTLPDTVEVHPGHMGSTSIGAEKKHNPFLR